MTETTIGRIELKVKGELRTGNTITAVTFSPDGDFVAFADEGGLVIIRQTWGRWSILRTYRAGNNIRGLVWHPTTRYTLFVSSGAGNLFIIPITRKADDDVARCRFIPGFIHSIAVNGDGTSLALGYCDERKGVVGIIEDPTSDLQQPLASVREGRETPHQLCYLGPDRLLIAYFEEPHFLVTDTNPPYSLIWRMEPPSGSYIGGMSLSPSRGYLAVTNLVSGVDLYSISERKHLTTSRYNPLTPTGTNRLAGIAYIDEDVVVAGHADGNLVGVWADGLGTPQRFPVTISDDFLPSLRIAHGVAGGTSTLIVSRGEGPDTRLIVAQLNLPGLQAAVEVGERMRHPSSALHRPKVRTRRTKPDSTCMVVGRLLIILLLAAGGYVYLGNTYESFNGHLATTIGDASAAISTLMVALNFGFEKSRRDVVTTTHDEASAKQSAANHPAPLAHPSPQAHQSHSGPVDALSPVLAVSTALSENKTLILGTDHPATIVVCTSTETKTIMTTETKIITTTVARKETTTPIPVAEKVVPKWNFFSLIPSFNLAHITTFLLFIYFRLSSQRVLATKNFLLAWGAWFIAAFICLLNALRRLCARDVEDDATDAEDDGNLRPVAPRPPRAATRPLPSTQRANLVDRGVPVGGRNASVTTIHSSLRPTRLTEANGEDAAVVRSGLQTPRLPHGPLQPVSRQEQQGATTEPDHDGNMIDRSSARHGPATTLGKDAPLPRVYFSPPPTQSTLQHQRPASLAELEHTVMIRADQDLTTAQEPQQVQQRAAAKRDGNLIDCSSTRHASVTSPGEEPDAPPRAFNYASLSSTQGPSQTDCERD